MLDECDAPIRYRPGNWSLGFYHRHGRSVGAFIRHCSSDEEIEAWTTAVCGILAATDAQEIWFPMGVGDHADHELARNACLRALSRNSGIEQRAKLFFYQDVPYANQFPEHTGQILEAISTAGGVLEWQREDISAALEGKLRMNAIYASQFKLSYMAPKIEEAARSASPTGEGCCELLFKVKSLPGPIEPLALYSTRDAVQCLADRLGSWYSRHRLAERIRILSPVGAGRWADDMSFLLKAFPKATFELHISDTTVGETAYLASPRIEIRTVTGRSGAWLKRLLLIAVGRPFPLIVLTGANRQGSARLIRAAFSLADPLPAINTNYLVQALRLVQGAARQGADL